MKRFVFGVLLAAVAGTVVSAAALEFRTVAENAAILYDAPSAKSKKLYVVSRGYPLEVLVRVEGWVKVRDSAGALTWIESRALSERRTVMIKVPIAPIRGEAQDGAPVVFEAQQDVVLDLVEVTAGGWARVRHDDGATGFVRVSQVWGL